MSTTYTIALVISFIFLSVILYLRFRNKSAGKFANVAMDTFEVLEVQFSKTEEPSKDGSFAALSAENMFSALHGLLRDDPTLQEHVSFEIASSGEGIRFYAIVPSGILKFVESQIYAQLPSAHIKVVPDYTARLKASGSYFEVASVTLTKPQFFPIKSFRDFEIDSIASFTSTLSQVGETDEIWFQLLARPIADTWQKEGFDYVKAMRDGTLTGPKGPDNSFGGVVKKELLEIATNMITGLFTAPKSKEDLRKIEVKPLTPRLSAGQELEMRSIENKLSRMGFNVQIRVLAAAATKEKVANHIRSVLASMQQFSSANLNGLTSTLEPDANLALASYVTRTIALSKCLLLNTEELATIFHFPTMNLDTPSISWVYSKSSEPPANLPVDNCVYIGETKYRNKKLEFGIYNNDDRLRHMYMIGKSGTGKSTLLNTMISQDINNGEGVAVLDPHGDTIESILERIPDNRIDDVIYFDPSDTERPIGLNMLEMSDPTQKNLMASGLVAAIKQHFDYSWGPRLEYLLNYAILTLLEVPGTSLLGITRLMEDQNYQKFILHQVKDPVVIKFWENEFKEMKGNQKLVTEAISPIQNKVNRFLASTTMRNILGQRNSTIDIWDVMNSGKILLINLSKGKIGSDNANMLGALLVSRIQFFALQRARIPAAQRKPFYLYVDEFQNFASGSFEEILSESRKYKLGLYLTHQFTAQLPEQLLKAVYGNVGTILSFSLGAPDARELEKEFAPYFTFEDILSLERFQVYIKLMINGMTSHPFSGRILIPWLDKTLDAKIPKTGNKEKVIARSREKYGVDREYVEGKINRWVETKFDKGMAIAQEYKGAPNSLPKPDEVKI